MKVTRGSGPTWQRRGPSRDRGASRTRLRPRPWLVLNAAGTLGRAHAAMHSHQAPDTLPDLRNELGQHIESAKALPPNLSADALERLRTLPDEDRLCHSDFHPANVLGTLQAPVIIDWGDASRGDPAADVARTLLLLRMGELPPDTSAGMRAMTTISRGMLTQRYLAVYRRHAGDKPSRLEDWMFVRAAARFNEELEVEYPRLQRLLEESLRTAK
jgi:aminoglycoside phosphotransferase (APT) family kinase protein